MSKKTTNTVKPYMYDVISRPVVTEKATMASEHGKVMFYVPISATKTEVKAAIETLFDVKVAKVNTIRLPGKTKRFRGMLGKQVDKKKAVVTLADGQEFDAMAGVK